MNLFSSGCVLFDCITGAYRMVEKTPFKIGSGEDCDWRIDDDLVALEHCVIQRKSNTYYLLSSPGIDGVLLDGMLNPGGQLTPAADHTLIVGARLFALRVGSGLEKWIAGMNSSEWFIYDKTRASKFGPVPFHELARELPRGRLQRRRSGIPLPRLDEHGLLRRARPAFDPASFS